MKYGKTFARESSIVHAALTPCLLDYRKWKRILSMKSRETVFTTYSSLTHFLMALQNECDHLDVLYKKIIRVVLTDRDKCPPWGCIGSCIIPLAHSLKDSAYRPSVSDCIIFQDMNTITLRKLCKRADKLLSPSVPGAQQWLNSAKASSKYAFLSGFLYKTLKLLCGSEENNAKPEECPVCFEQIEWSIRRAEHDTIEGTIVVMACGHVVCTECVLRMCSMQNRVGTLRNLLGVCRESHQLACPVCRDRKPLRNLDQRLCIWPTSARCVMVRGVQSVPNK